jgi:hypothetical protein
VDAIAKHKTLSPNVLHAMAAAATVAFVPALSRDTLMRAPRTSHTSQASVLQGHSQGEAAAMRPRSSAMLPNNQTIAPTATAMGNA